MNRPACLLTFDDRPTLRHTHISAGLVVLLAWLSAVGSCRADDLTDLEREPIRYSSEDVDDPVSRLARKVASGEVRMDFREPRGYLDSLLQQLNVLPSSQMLVFSKTSLQQRWITPHTPRAVYFNDDVYVAWVQHGEMLELSAVDPRKGANFYTVRQRAVERPAFLRSTGECLQCHASPRTRGVPGHIMRSVWPDATGLPVFNVGTRDTTHRSPFSERWGGWYVTGTHGRQLHMGNVFTTDRDDPQLDFTEGANVTELGQLLDIRPYATSHSDIVALMVFAHQIDVHNCITRANYLTRRAEEHQKGIREVLGRSNKEHELTLQRRVKYAAKPLVEALFFVNEPRLRQPVRGTSLFSKEFMALGPRDQRGRSLRDLDLDHRLFLHPLSFLIYSEAFGALPARAKQHVLRRVWEVLTGRDAHQEFAHLTESTRGEILTILLETLPDLPSYWRPRRRRL